MHPQHTTEKPFLRKSLTMFPNLKGFTKGPLARGWFFVSRNSEPIVFI